MPLLRAALPPGVNLTREVGAVVVDLRAHRLQVVAASGGASTWERSDAVAARLGALAVINGGYFDEQRHPLGWVVSNGQQRIARRANRWPCFVVQGQRARIVSRQTAANLSDVQQAVQCGPRLVEDGRPTQLKDSPRAARSAVGIDDQGRVVLAATLDTAATLAEFAAVLARSRDRGGLGCQEALNLDGGPSTQFCVPGRANVSGLYAMPTHLAVLP
ncbi:MAG: phosphodiester glycosidase family protein [Fimbriimonadaceae bacterium]|nr:phosphodiester glycosidase family protein [Fimbriimonadaceae bacterium]